MNKKSQFYIITALVLIVATFSIYSGFLSTTKPVTVFQELYTNYEIESPKVVNSALFNNKDPGSELRNFTVSFVNFARTRDPDFRMLYVFVNNNSIEIGNYLDIQVNASSNSSNVVVGPNNNANLPLASEIRVKVDRFNYKFKNLTNSDIGLRSLFRTEKDRETKVHVNG